MIKPLDLFNINYYKKNPFHGSYRGMHYRIRKHEEDEVVSLEVIYWPGPYNFETTDDSLKTTKLFPFSNDGLKEICDYLNETHASGNYSTRI